MQPKTKSDAKIYAMQNEQGNYADSSFLNNEVKAKKNSFNRRSPIDLEWDNDEDMSIMKKRSIIKRQTMDGSLKEMKEFFSIDDLDLDTEIRFSNKYFSSPQIRELIFHRFDNFIKNYVSDEDEKIYLSKLNSDTTNFEISYYHLCTFCPILAFWSVSTSKSILPIFSECLNQIAHDIGAPQREINVTITNIF